MNPPQGVLGQYARLECPIGQAGEVEEECATARRSPAASQLGVSARVLREAVMREVEGAEILGWQQ